VRKLLLLGVLVAVLLAVDLLARAAAETAVEDGVRAKVQGVGSVDARIHSFPFTGRLLAQGEVATLDLRLSDVTGHGIDVARLRLLTRGLELDRRLLVGGKVKVERVDEVTVTATITEAEVRELTGADVRLHEGRADVTAAGVTVGATVVVQAGQIRLGAGSIGVLRVPVPDSELLPCAVDARVVEGAILASCTADHLPDIVLRAVGTVDLQDGR
jgi:hypothetical protein